VSDAAASAHLDALAAILRGSPHLRFLGLSCRVVDGCATVVLAADERHVGDATRRTVHGGVLAAALEAAARAELEVASGRPARAVDFTSEFLRAATLVDTVFHVEITRRGRRFAHVRTRACQQESHHVVAVGHGTFALG
jgi:acyl-coenzyme A thioesterase PaaI-like protein